MKSHKIVTDTTTPLHLLEPDYEIPYTIPEEKNIANTLGKILAFLEQATPEGLLDSVTKQPVADPATVNLHTIFKPGDFRLTSYEWGVTYIAMLLASEITGDLRFADYVLERLNLIESVRPYFKHLEDINPGYRSPVHSVIYPNALDDAGAMCVAFLKAGSSEGAIDFSPITHNFIDYIRHRQFRFPDGTLARNYPHRNTLWIDDLFMSVPALAHMAHISGESALFDDAVHQVLRFSERMFIREKGLFIHGWVLDMQEHPPFHWGRANGWALMAMVELLEKLPVSHPGRESVLEIMKAHVKGLAGLQSGNGMWHQLLDRADSYRETSATAIFSYAIAKAINIGLIGAKEYGPVALIAWNAVDAMVNEKGKVEGTCVGTGMGFDPAFYYHRPVNPFAAHGYGPAILAGAEMIRLLRNFSIEKVENALQFFEMKQDN